MLSILKVYFGTFISPFGIYEREGRSISIDESILVSWIIEIIHSMMNFVLFLILTLAYEHTALNLAKKVFPTLLNDLILKMGLWGGYFNLTMVLFSLIVFPFYAYVTFEVWHFFYKRLLSIFSKDADLGPLSREVVARGLCSGPIKLIPLVGGVISRVYFLILMYGALRKRVGLDSSAALFVICFPLVFFGLLIATIAIYIFSN